MQSDQARPIGLMQGPDRCQLRRLSTLVFLLTLCFGGLIARLAYLQVVLHDEKLSAVTRMGTSYRMTRGDRGDIIDRNGVILARDVRQRTIALDPSRISAGNLPAVLDVLCRGLGMADEERRAIGVRIEARKDSKYVMLRRGVSEGLAAELLATIDRVLPPEERSAVISKTIHFREYPRGSLLGQVIGWVKPGIDADNVEGGAGLELVLDPSLKGTDGKRMFRTEGQREDFWYAPGVVDVHPIQGYTAHLTIDSGFQGIAEEELERVLERERAAAGSVVVMNCRNGDILAMANLPSLDPNHYRDYPQQEFEQRRWIRAISSQFEPGSTIKAFTAAVAYEKGLFGLDDVIWEGGRIWKYGPRTIQDVSNHGVLTFAKAVIYSSNIGMTHVGLKLGRDGLIDVLDRFHFQRPTGVLLPGEAKGKRTARNKWTESYTTVSVSFGYEVMVTPIQLCAAFGAVVNGGHLYAPRLVERLERDEDKVEFPVREVGRPIKESTSAVMREMLVGVVEEGTAKCVRIPGFRFGGKTGTRVSVQRAGKPRDVLSSFVCFAPADDPQVVIAVLVEQPKVHSYGGTVAGPVAAGILKKIFRIEPQLTADAHGR